MTSDTIRLLAIEQAAQSLVDSMMRCCECEAPGTRMGNGAAYCKEHAPRDAGPLPWEVKLLRLVAALRATGVES